MDKFDKPESHPSYVAIRASRVSCSPGQRLFDSEVHHSHYITVTINRVERHRELNRDWIFPREELIEVAMSAAQWGAFVSSFGEGSGVPATLFHLGSERVDDPPDESRLDISHAEVLNAANEGVASIREAFEGVKSARAAGGKRILDGAMRGMEAAIRNAPKNMEFAAKSLTEHTENVVTKARADIEAMVLNVQGVRVAELPFMDIPALEA